MDKKANHLLTLDKNVLLEDLKYITYNAVSNEKIQKSKDNLIRLLTDVPMNQLKDLSKELATPVKISKGQGLIDEVGDDIELINNRGFKKDNSFLTDASQGCQCVILPINI
jgi:hypothetical protein